MKHTISMLAAASILLSPVIASAAPKPRVVLDAALEGEGSYAGKGYFFAAGYYISYDWANDRVDDGPRPLSAWPVDGAYLGGVDAAIDGAAGYAGKGYFFKSADYLRYDWPSEVIDQGSQPLTAWKLSGDFARRIDSAINGKEQFAGYAYFFRGGSYVKYDWTNDRIVGGLRSIAAGWHLTGAFASRIDAAINGAGQFAGRGYFFTNDEYVRYIWKTDRPDGAPEKIVDKWPGLVEMAQAARGSAEALTWIAAALPALRADLAAANLGKPSAPGTITTALATHFHLTTVADRKRLLPVIIKNFEDSQATLINPTNVYKFRTLAEAAADRQPNAFAYASSGTSIRFTPTFTKVGPKAQAAIVLHESIHYVDVQPTPDTYEREDGYATLTADQAAHNPSSYPSFAAHVLTGKNELFGGGRPDE